MNNHQSLDQLMTEQVNPASEAIDTFDPLQIVELMNQQDAQVVAAVRKIAPEIANAISLIAEKLGSGGRLIYVGAGTSGRLGVLDASECPPTFSTDPSLIIGVIAGGDVALRTAVEGAEDRPEEGRHVLQQLACSAKDVVVGIASSGRTPFVLGAIEYALECKAKTIGLACNEGSPLEQKASLMLMPLVGPEIIAGSTRMKAGTATKMILNMLTTGVMIRLGKTYGNLMVDLTATNQKLEARTLRLVQRLTGCSTTTAVESLQNCDGELKTAVVCLTKETTPTEARRILAAVDGHLRRALESEPDE